MLAVALCCASAALCCSGGHMMDEHYWNRMKNYLMSIVVGNSWQEKWLVPFASLQT